MRKRKASIRLQQSIFSSKINPILLYIKNIDILDILSLYMFGLSSGVTT